MSEPGVTSVERGPSARRRKVREQVLLEGFARLEDLANRFDVSQMTMHRDLDALQAEGWLVKIRGGATANPSALVEAGVAERRASMQREKAAIAREASRMLAHGQTLFLDDSTTVLAMVEHLVARPPTVLATNFVGAVPELRNVPTTQLQIFGGEYHALQESCQGQLTVDAIDRMHADLCFMSTTAISDGRCLHRSEQTVVVRKAFMRNSAHNVLLVDHAKFGRPAPHVLCELGVFDTVVVDDGIDEDDLATLRDVCDDVRVAAL